MSRKRKDLSIVEKLELLREYDKLPKCSQRYAAFKLGISQPLLCRILKNRQFCKASNVQNVNVNRKRKRSGKSANVEEALLRWFNNARLNDVPITRAVLCKKAKEFAGELGEANFIPTDGWLTRFKDRHNIVYKKHRENECDTEVVESKIGNDVLPCLLEEFAPEDIFCAAETGIYYRAMPKHCMFGNFPAVSERKQKVRITALLTCNMTGTIKQPLLVIGKGKSPQCFQNVKNLPVEYKNNTNAWMTSEIFTNFLTEWDKKLSSRNKKIALLLDSRAAHLDVRLKNIKLVLSFGMTAITQPLNQGVITAFKAMYRNAMQRKIIMEVSDGELNANDIAERISLLDAIHMMANAWNLVSETTIINCFDKAGFKIPTAIKTEEVIENFLPSESEFCTKLINNWDFQAWVNIDADLPTSDEPTVHEPVDGVEVKPSIVYNMDDNSDDSSGEHCEYVPQSQDIRNALQTLRAALQFRGGCNADYNAFYNLENCMERLILPDMEQQTLEMFFKSSI